MKRKPNDSRKNVRLANGLSFLIPPYAIHEYSNSVKVDFPSGSRLFAKWYVTIS